MIALLAGENRHGTCLTSLLCALTIIRSYQNRAPVPGLLAMGSATLELPKTARRDVMRIFRMLMVLVAASLAAGQVLAQDTLKKIKDSGVITVGHRDASIPFSYYDDKQQPVGYAMDLCAKIVDAVKADLKMPKLEVKYQLVTSANRIPLIANGTVDLECGSTTNNVERQKQVSFTMTHFLTASRYVTKKSSNIKSIDDLKGKTIVSTAGTTNIKQATDLNTAKNMGMNIVPANGHPEAFQMVETGRAVAFVMDDVIIA